MVSKGPAAKPKRGRPFAESKVGDVTRTERSRAHLERLGDAKGKRLVVDLDAPGRKALERLLEAGYGDSQKAVVIQALIAAVATLKTNA